MDFSEETLPSSSSSSTTTTTTTILNQPQLQKRSVHLVHTDTTELQEITEDECSPFFVDLASLRKHSQDHLRETGLLPPLASTTTTIATDGRSSCNQQHETNDHDLDVCLLKEKHYAYLSRVFLPSEQPLGSNLVSLDASRPWMMYWTLHGCDLLLTNEETKDDNEMKTGNNADTCNSIANSLLLSKVGDDAMCAIVSTLEACWQIIPRISLPHHLKLTEEELSLLQKAPSASDNTDDKTYYIGGGFGGGPGQLAHVATSYAAVLTLCIVATSDGPKSSQMAWETLEQLRKPMYAWLLSLQQSHGGFRMHHDGEIDVRASYTVFCMAKLLNILTPALASMLAVKFIASCQTYEGGFGGEPFTEAHGGYAYCAVAALQLVDRLDDAFIDMTALRGWLARRQLGYEGGFSGRANKLVDGCYSFWQGGANCIVSAHYAKDYNSWAASAKANNRGDVWTPAATATQSDEEEAPFGYAMLFDKPMLQRYILLCAQDVNGGLRDKPSKPRDFYHSCYNLSGLALSQHYGNAETEGSQANYGHPTLSRVAKSHPCYNIRQSRVRTILEHFKGDS